MPRTTKSFVVRLKEDDDQRLRYVADQIGVGAGTTVVRMLIRAASEGKFVAGALSFNFRPFSSVPRLEFPSTPSGAENE